MAAIYDYHDLIHFTAGLAFLSVSAIAYILGRCRQSIMCWTCMALFGVFAAAGQWFEIIMPAFTSNTSYTPFNFTLAALCFTALLAFALLTICSRRQLCLLDVLPLAVGIVVSVCIISVGAWKLPFALTGVYGLAATFSAISVIISNARGFNGGSKRNLYILAGLIAVFYISQGVIFMAKGGAFLSYTAPSIQIIIAVTMTLSLYIVYRGLIPGYRWTREMQKTVCLCVLLLVATTIAAGIGANYLAKSTSNDSHATILHNTMTAASALDDIKFSDIFDCKTMVNAPIYLHALSHLRSIIAVNDTASSAYLMGRKGNSVFFYADVVSGNIADSAMPGEFYPEATPLLKSVFDTGIGLAGDYSTDKWGTWISGLVPIKDPVTHRVIALLGIDYDFKAASAQIMKSRIPVLVIAMLISILIMAFVIIMGVQNDAAQQIEASILRARNAEKQALDDSFFLKTLIDSMPTPVFYKNIDGVYIGCNKAFEDYQGITIENILGKTASDILMQESAQEHLESDNELLCSGGTQIYESSVISAAGGKRDVVFYKALYCNSIGEPEGIIGTIGDITEIRAIETALALEKERLQITLQSIGDAVMATDSNGNLILMNAIAVELTGWKEVDAIGLPLCQVFSIINDHTGEPVENSVDKVLRTGEMIGLANHTSIISRCGEQCSIAYSCAPIRDEIGTLQGAVLVFRDVSEQYEAELRIKDAELRYRTLFNESPNGVCLVDVETGLPIEFNEMAHNLLGYTREEFAAIPVFAHHDTAQIRNEVPELWNLPVGGRGDIDTCLVAKDGSKFHVQISFRMIEIGGRKLCSSITLDVTERENRQAVERMQNTAVNAASDQIVITDTEGCITFVNHSFEIETGYSSDEVLGCNPNILSSGRHDDVFYEHMWRTIMDGHIWSGEVVNKRKDRTLYIDDMNISPVKNDQGVIECFIAIKRNVTDRKSYEEKLDHLAHHDNLTGLPNRLMFNDKLNHSLKIARTSQKGLAVLFIDLDRFKNINDTLGHNVGDTLLRESAERFKNCLRESDILARMGGDEFTVIVNNVRNQNDAFGVAERIQQELSRAFVLEDHEVIISASIGVSLYPESGTDSRSLIMNADTAMYRAKEHGRNSCLLYSETMNTRAMERLKLEYGLRGALDRGEFVLHYQPRVDAHSGELVGAEALLRWMRPEIGLVSPADFIPMAEETGLIVPIGEWVIQEAAKQNRQWQQDGLLPICISVNVSPRQFQQADILLTAFQSIMDDTGGPLSYLEVEITEGALMDHPDDVIVVLGKLKDMGLRISIDDFGTGYSSLSYLKRFPIDAVKIDRSFIQDIQVNPEDASICCAIMAMAHNLGMIVVTEGVETIEQYEYMKAIACDEIQGYLTGRPLPADKFKVVLQKASENKQSRNVA